MYTKALALAAVALAPAVAAQYSVNIYWGQKTGASLARVCESDGFEYITLSFLNKSPEQDQSGLGYPGSNFAGNCGASVSA
jgi:chitinase